MYLAMYKQHNHQENMLVSYSTKLASKQEIFYQHKQEIRVKSPKPQACNSL